MSLKAQNNKALKQIVNNLIKRRQQQENRIKKLIDPYLNQEYQTNNSMKQDESIFSEMLKKLDTQQPEYLQQNLSHFGNHVNLLATISLKTEVHLQQKHKIRQKGLLYSNLKDRFKDQKIVINFEVDIPSRWQSWFKQLAQYIVEQQMYEGLIVIQETTKNHYDYYMTCFNEGKYEEICVSKQELKEQELEGVIIDQESVNIAWLLVKRGFVKKDGKDMNLAKSLHNLYSFPYKSFDIKFSKQLLLLNEYLGLFNTMSSQTSKQSFQNNQNIQLYGIDEYSNESSSITTIQKGNINTNIQSYNSILQQFNQIIVVDETQYPVKYLPLCCIDNHFVIITLKVKQKGFYHINLGATIDSSSSHKQYKVIIIDEQFDIIKSQIIKNNQFLSTFLQINQYQLYIFPFGSHLHPQQQDQSFQLVKQSQHQFNLWIQSRHIFHKNDGQLELELRLKQKYNTYSYQIAQHYLERMNKIVNKNKKQKMAILDYEQLNDDEVLIKRYILTKIHLIMDHILCKYEGKVTIEYKDLNLCDNLFEEKVVVLKGGAKVMLYCQTEIQRITVQNSQKTLSKRIVRSYI